MIDEDAAKKIKAAGVAYVGVSLDGPQHVNDEFRGKKGAYGAAMRGIQNCVAVGQRVGLRFTINKANVSHLDEIFDFIEREHIDRACFYHLVYAGRGETMANEDVTPAESRRAMDTIIRRTRDYEARGLEKEILTVDNHCDGVYLYLTAKRGGDEALAERIWGLISMNGGNRSGIAFGEVDPEGNVHPDQTSVRMPTVASIGPGRPYLARQSTAPRWMRPIGESAPVFSSKKPDSTPQTSEP